AFRERQGACSAAPRAVPPRQFFPPQIGAASKSCVTARSMAGQHAFHDEGSAPTPPLKALELGDEALLDDVMTSSREGAPLSEEAGDGGPAEGPPRAYSLGMLGGARADFVAELGRRVAELTSLAGQLSADPKSTRLRDDLRRRMHGLAAGARLLRFNRLAARLAESEALLHAAAARGEIAPDEVAGLCAV